jgi:outer membrane protein assembly factor BamB
LRELGLNTKVSLGICAITLLLTAACAKREEIFEGQRFDIRLPLSASLDAQDGTEVIIDDNATVNAAPSIRLPATRNYNSWSHRNGGPTHRIVHPAFGSEPELMWATSIGAGNERRNRIVADPVVGGGRIYTVDSHSVVSATSFDGQQLWQRALAPSSDDGSEASAGGVSYADGRVYATTGFGAVVAIDAENGAEIWRQKINASLTAAPTVMGQQVYVISRDNKAFVINAKTGRLLWQQVSSGSDAVLIGGASAADGGRVVLLPFGNGELSGVLKKSGIRIWSASVSGARRGQARSNIGDLTSDPVVDGGRIYAGNQSGRLVALSRRDGTRIWTATEGSYSPVWPSGGSVFMVSDAAQLIRLNGKDGSVIWAQDLPKYANPKHRRTSFAHYGPVLAGGRLLVASADGELRSFDPTSGDLLSSVDIPGGAASHPAIVNGVLYIVSQKGQLLAFR